ncbi:hypothetical protein [Ulvibacterium marinum]|uniref:Viral A-type inclusion protein n=1 Tax=Ulvibacterium marinum TaxID=2419782 RepID=A0A3B0CG18_9FLAO|nr:hypothetical protein [Ulvibacterium marinum]RKN83139.1 hypothetical protein D7Z94_04675 [Ulvibacterium marinum]
MKRTVFLFAVLAMAISCKEDKKSMANPNTEQMEKVMAIHDEVMPKMGIIGKLVAELKPKVDSTEMGIHYEKAMKDLQASHQSMMDWMRGFGDRFDSDEILNGKALTEQKQKWLDEEEVKVKALKEEINSSIERAQAVLKKQD